MFTRKRFQHGSLTKEKRSSGPDVWIFRWREFSSEGKRVNRKTVVGTVQQYRTASAAEEAVAARRLDISKETPHSVRSPITIAQLAAHFVEKELSEDSKRKAYSTRGCYRRFINRWILPRWGQYPTADVRTVAVEEWLGGLGLANGTKAKIRNIMHALYAHAMRYEWHDRNPITLVRQSAKRERIPDVLAVEEIAALLGELQEPFRTMVFLAAATGLLRSELFALRWSDVDFEAKQISVSRGVVNQVVGELKTEASRRPVALDPDLAESLKALKGTTKFCGPDDWVFASPAKDGKQPYWPDMVLERHVVPAARRCGITKRLGWHTFRHTLATLAKANGEDVKVVQEMLRHANSHITLDIYTQAVTADKRAAQTKVVQMILPKEWVQAASNAG